MNFLSRAHRCEEIKYDKILGTIEIFNQNHNYLDFEKRRAYPANCRHPQFQSSCREQLQEFRNKYHFTLVPKATIVIE